MTVSVSQNAEGKVFNAWSGPVNDTKRRRERDNSVSALEGGHENDGRDHQLRDDVRGNRASSSDKLGEELSPRSRRIRGPG